MLFKWLSVQQPNNVHVSILQEHFNRSGSTNYYGVLENITRLPMKAFMYKMCQEYETLYSETCI